MSFLYPSESDLPYEEEVLREPFKLQGWRRYLAACAGAPPQKRFLIYERAVRALPGSYKMWHAYLTERVDAARSLPVSDPSYASLNSAFERALATMHKMPRIWLMYLASLAAQRRITRARRAFDRALRSLPLTQHALIWPDYLALVSLPGVPVETALRVRRRYLLFDPSHLEDYIESLLRSSRCREAADRLAAALDDESFRSVKGKTRHQLWLELCGIATRHAADVAGLNVEAIIRGGIRRFTDDVGPLWSSLANYHVRRGFYEKARDVFEAGLRAVSTARDFGVVFEAYMQFEQSLLAAKLETAEAVAIGKCWLNDRDDADFALARMDRLLDRRPELLSCVLLRQNPHNVELWHRRVKLFEGDPSMQVSTYVQALETVDPTKAVGKPHTLWIAFSRMYESRNLLDSAEEVFKRATRAKYKSVDHLATVWCEWTDMELRHNNFEKALQLMRQATAVPSVKVKKMIQSRFPFSCF